MERTYDANGNLIQAQPHHHTPLVKIHHRRPTQPLQPPPPQSSTNMIPNNYPQYDMYPPPNHLQDTATYHTYPPPSGQGPLSGPSTDSTGTGNISMPRQSSSYNAPQGQLPSPYNAYALGLPTSSTRDGTGGAAGGNASVSSGMSDGMRGTGPGSRRESFAESTIMDTTSSTPGSSSVVSGDLRPLRPINSHLPDSGMGTYMPFGGSSMSTGAMTSLPPLSSMPSTHFPPPGHAAPLDWRSAQVLNTGQDHYTHMSGSYDPRSGPNTSPLQSRRNTVSTRTDHSRTVSTSGRDNDSTTASPLRSKQPSGSKGKGKHRESISSSASGAVGRSVEIGNKKKKKAGDAGGKKVDRQTIKREEPVDEDELADGDVEPEDESKMDHRKRKRNRTIRSCVPCHNHKRKCDRKRPCGRCTALGLTGTCVYEVDEARDMSDPTVAESERLRRRIAELEQVVRELRQRQPHRSTTSAFQAPRASITVKDDIADVSDPAMETGQDHKKRRVIVDRFARFKIDEAAMMAVATAAAKNEMNGRPASSRSRQSTSAARHSGESDEDDEDEGHADGINDHNREGRHHESTTGHNEDDDGNDNENDNDNDNEAYRTEPYSTYLLPGEEMVSDRTGRRTFLGASAGKSMLRRLREITHSNRRSGDAKESDLLLVPEDAAFTGVFPDLRKTFPFTTIWSHENFSGEIIGLLPNKQQSEALLTTWKDEVCAYFLAWHVPTLEADYRRFFSMSNTDKMTVPLSSLALYLMICSLGCVMRASRTEIFGHPDADGRTTGTPTKQSKDSKDLTSSRLQSELYLSGAYQALRLCSFMSNPSIPTIQAQILINIYLFNSERAADAWAQSGSLVRQCIAIGLHVDPATLDAKISLREAEIRRRIWWTVAGLDALLCVSFGRPSVINFYKTNLPQDRPDDNLSDAPGTAQQLLPPSNVLSNETTDMTFHAAYFQLTIPSYELLDRIFHVDRTYSRSAIYGWFSPAPDSLRRNQDSMDSMHTYEDAIRLAEDIFQWYAHIPRGMRFDPDGDMKASLRSDSSVRVNQRLILCSKTFMLVMVLHRPYLRLDPAAYPDSSDICYRAAHRLLTAFRVGADARASALWTWWTMSYRAFHAGAVCAFLAIRQPGTSLARACMEDLRGAIHVLEDRMSSWNTTTTHHVQADLCHGLIRLEKLASAATKQSMNQPHSSPSTSGSGGESHASLPNPGLLSAHWTSHTGEGGPGGNSGTSANAGGSSPTRTSPQGGGSNGTSSGPQVGGALALTSGVPGSGSLPFLLSPDASFSFHPSTPLSEIRGFPEPSMPVPVTASPAGAGTGNTALPSLNVVPPHRGSPSPRSGHGQAGGSRHGHGQGSGGSSTGMLGSGNHDTLTSRQPSPLLMASPFQNPEFSLQGDGFTGTDAISLPDFWASMFGIKMEGDGDGDTQLHTQAQQNSQGHGQGQ